MVPFNPVPTSWVLRKEEEAGLTLLHTLKDTSSNPDREAFRKSSGRSFIYSLPFLMGHMKRRGTEVLSSE
jgi:hypothetical protein